MLTAWRKLLKFVSKENQTTKFQRSSTKTLTWTYETSLWSCEK